LGDHGILTSLMRPFYRKGSETTFQVPDALGPRSRLLCIDTGDLSELLFHAPLLNALRRRHPELEIDFLLPEEHAPLVVPSGLARQCTLYHERQLSPWRPAFASLLKKLGQGGYDMAVVASFESHPRLELAALASGAGLRLGPSHGKNYPAINCELRPGDEPDSEGYLGDRLLRLAPFLCLDPHPLDFRWPLPLDRVRHIAQQIHFHKPNPDQMLIGVDPGPGKTGFAFALDNLEFLARQLGTQLVCRILPLGVPDDEARLKAFSDRLGRVPVGLPCDDLLERVLLLSQCNLFISGNTDFFHMAVALGVPAVGLFSPHDGPRWRPRGRSNARVLTLTKGEKVDIATLMEAVSEVTRGRTSNPSQPVGGDGVGLPGSS